MMIMHPMKLDITPIATQQELQGVQQGSAWMLAQCARLHDGPGNKAFSSLLAAIVASLVMFGLQ